MSQLRVACAQIDTRVGDFEWNTAKILESMAYADGVDADVLLLPELAICGYPPEDLLLRGSFTEANREALERIAAQSGQVAVVVGFVDRVAGATSDDAVSRRIANAAAVVAGGSVVGVYHKVLLPNYGVFDEARYFAVGRQRTTLWSIAGVTAGVSVCEDIWSPTGPPAHQAAAGAQILLNINGSPYHVGKAGERAGLLSAEARRSGVPVVYLNMVGGQDELVFDGDSMVIDSSGDLIHRAPQFAVDHFVVDVPVPPGRAGEPAELVSVTPSRSAAKVSIPAPVIVPTMNMEEEVYTALVTGLRDYVEKNGFSDVVIGLSGGIDSALTAAIATDALGPGAVWGITMPTRYSSEGSITDSEDLAKRLGIRFDIIPIDPVFAEFLEALEVAFAGTDMGVAEENLQARIRGAILMAISNKFGGMVVATGNKSEMAVGYATLYGDMAGGFAVLKDVFKTLVYRLAEWRNQQDEVIPRTIIDKPPSAELRPDQKDTDSLPEYEVLDAMLRRYIELDMAVGEIVAEGLGAELVRRVAAMVDRNEYKRRQAAPGVRITRKAFGRDRRLPITNAYRTP